MVAHRWDRRMRGSAPKTTSANTRLELVKRVDRWIKAIKAAGMVTTR